MITLASAYPGDRATGTAAVPQALLEEILQNPTGFYFNVHNADFGAGAIRGQVAVQPYAETLYFPIVGHVDGLNNTRFVADARVVNRSGGTSTAFLEFFPSTPAGLSASSVTRGVNLAAGQELVVNDVVSSQFSTTGLGALKIGVADADDHGRAGLQRSEASRWRDDRLLHSTEGDLGRGDRGSLAVPFAGEQ